MRRILIIIFFIFLILFNMYLWFRINQIEIIQNKYKSLIEQSVISSKKFYFYVYQNFPIFEDWLDYQRFQKLRTHLYPEHIRIAKEKSIPVIKNHSYLNSKEIKRQFVSIDRTSLRKYYFFYNVRKQNRMMHKNFIFILSLIGQRFNHKIRFKKFPVQVKFAISSALRTQEYQNQLKNKNINAIENSTHSYGISFDIFYDEFFVSFPFLCREWQFQKQLCESLVRQIGFLSGRSLRRQLQSILAETLLELQEEKKLYVILEKNQRVFHITAIPE